MTSSPPIVAVVAFAVACGAWIAACDECETSRDCGTGEACIDGACQSPEPYDPGSDSDSDTDLDVDADSDSDTDGDTDDPYAIEWVEIPGGTFPMGYDLGQDDEVPVHDVSVPTFEMTRSEITVIQYSPCVADAVCAAPATGNRLNWEVEDRFTHPVNGVTWLDADTFCAYAGGRLPSEAEWEYAARSAGQDLVYPWGDELPSCNYCVMKEEDATMGCGEGHTWPVCAKPNGDTEQGLCDMTGNAYEWVADYYYNTYAGAPTDGSPWDEPPYPEYADRTIRGGSYQSTAEISALRTSGRLGYTELGWEPDLGFRCARDVQ